MSQGDYVVFVDESGDHNLTSFDPLYPRFVLAFCVFPIREYVEVAVPLVERLKFDYFGHDLVVFHEREIRQSRAPFSFLLDAALRAPFLERLDELISAPRFGIVSTVIRKPEFVRRRGTDVSPYDIALEYGLERVFLQLQQRSQTGRRTKVIFEGRGRAEDAELESSFGRIMDETTQRCMAQTLDFLCASKQTNSAGLQVADLVARPIGIHDLRPDQPNHAWDMLEPKIVRGPAGQIEGYGLKLYP